MSESFQNCRRYSKISLINSRENRKKVEFSSLLAFWLRFEMIVPESRFEHSLELLKEKLALPFFGDQRKRRSAT
jgi:hypothetical protein